MNDCNARWILKNCMKQIGLEKGKFKRQKYGGEG